ncbi:MAG: hypothetical protein IPP53_07285 [Bacteroidetes bacterium]|nr:hypothetical protein [Bacteroidota bacterium]
MIAKLDKFYVNQYIITFRALQTIVLPHYFLPFCRDSLKTTIDTYIKRNKASDNTILFKVMQTPGVLVQKTDKPAIENPYFDTIAADHPMYSQFLNKETAGWCLQYLQLPTSPLLEVRSQLQFKLIMYGKIDLIWQEPDWISILQQWAQNGLGIPNAAFALQDIEAPPIMGIHQQEQKDTQ